MPSLEVIDNADRQSGSATAQLSALCRSTDLALIATIWLYAGGLTQNGKFNVTFDYVQAHGLLNAALFLLLVSLAADLIQYAVAAVLWQWWKRSLLLLLVPATSPDRAARSAKAWEDTFAGRYLRAEIQASPAYKHLSHAPDGWDFGNLREQLEASGELHASVLDEGRYPGIFNIPITGLMWLKVLCLAAAFGCLIGQFAS